VVGWGKKRYNFDMCMRELSENCSGAILCMERKKIQHGKNKLNETCNVEIGKKIKIIIIKKGGVICKIFDENICWAVLVELVSALRNRILKCHKI
jgi:predicted DNA-binding protein (UPF0278 family)